MLYEDKTVCELRKKEDAHGNNSFSDSRYLANRCSTVMAIQQELGLLAQRRYWHDPADCADSFAARQNIKHVEQGG